MNSKVLLVEDSTSLSILYKEYLKSEPYDFFHVDTGKKAIDFIQKYSPQVVILDLQLPDIAGSEILDWINKNQIPVSVIIATAHGSIDIAVDLIQHGAKDFLEKPIKADRLRASIRLHLENAKLNTLVDKLKVNLDQTHFHGFIGASLSMQSVYQTIKSVAPTTASVFINGESGTGKEVCAEAIHLESERRNKPFIALNCAAIPKDLLESEIFGHVKGSFTGATTDRKGAAMMADGGTLFLDELCEMELEMQKKLLRFLQTSKITPLGSNKEYKVNIRILCATNKDPLHEVEMGNFREDLYYRVHVIPINMPALRERDDDIILLATHFLKEFSKTDNRDFIGFSKESKQALKSYHWPGNVRELQNIIRNIVVLNNGKYVQLEQLPPQITTKKPKESNVVPNLSVISTVDKSPPKSDQESTQTAVHFTASDNSETKSNVDSSSTIRPMWEVEKEMIQKAIDLCDGNVLNAAVMLELSPSTVYRKKQAWDNE